MDVPRRESVTACLMGRRVECVCVPFVFGSRVPTHPILNSSHSPASVRGGNGALGLSPLESARGAIMGLRTGGVLEEWASSYGVAFRHAVGNDYRVRKLSGFTYSSLFWRVYVVALKPRDIFEAVSCSCF